MSVHSRVWNKFLSFLSGQKRACGRKVQYRRESALRASKNMSLKYGKFMDAYNCYWCDRWHIGGKMDVGMIMRFALLDLLVGEFQFIRKPRQ
jgi:hypothetical protein